MSDLLDSQIKSIAVAPSFCVQKSNASTFFVVTACFSGYIRIPVLPVLDPQSNTTSWIGVGHKDAMGTTGINQFGKDFRKVGGNWKRLCVLDSDGDGQSNGMELGDPCCVWKKGDIPFRVWDISHPGTRSSITKAKRPVCPGETVLSRTLASLYRLGLEEMLFSTEFPPEIAYFCRYLYFQKYISLKSPLTRCAGELAVCNLGILLFPVSRNSPLWSIMGTCFERTLLYHRLLGYWTLFLTSWHAFGMFHSYMFQSRGFAFLFSFSSTHVRFNLPGIFAHLFLLLLGVLALHRIRRKAFEVFYYSHVILFPFCLIFTVLHIGFAAYYLAPGLLSLGIDYMLRIYRTYEVIPLKIRVFQDAVRITLVGPREWTTEGIGGHLGFFKVPHLAWLQSHPFSIFSLDSNTFDIIVRRGMTRSFTDKLYKACQGYSLFYNNDELVEELQFANGRMLGENDRNISTVSWLSVEKDISSKSILRVDSKQLPQMPRITCFYGLKKEFIQYLLQLTFSREISFVRHHVRIYGLHVITWLTNALLCLVRNNENSTEPLVSLTPDNILGSNFFRHDKQGLDCYIENGYKRLEEGCKVSLNEMIIQVQGPYGSLPVNPFHFSSILLCAGGVGITGILSILCDIYQHSKRNIFEDITLCWTISNTAHFEWVQDVLFSIQEDHLLKYVVHYEIYITNGDFPCLIDSSFSQTIHFYRGRPDWNTVICNWRHESLLLGIHKGISYICGPPSMVSQVQEHCRLLENDNWSCTTSTETFEF
ncbi:Temptin [Galdieria sulphuraria]|nr:Temptin [Galdieria sulphuraria]